MSGMGETFTQVSGGIPGKEGTTLMIKDDMDELASATLIYAPKTP